MPPTLAHPFVSDYPARWFDSIVFDREYAGAWLHLYSYLWSFRSSTALSAGSSHQYTTNGVHRYSWGCAIDWPT